MLRRSFRLVPVLILIAGIFLARGWTEGGDRARRATAPTPVGEVALEPLTVRLVRVLDGDSLIVRDQADRNVEVRIHAIDAPERRQPYADRSRRSLDRLLRDQEILLIPRTRDRYDRVVGRLIVDGRDAGLEQVQAGLAWHYRRYEGEQPPEERALYRNAEDEARKAETGLWKDPSPVPPWQTRRQ